MTNYQDEMATHRFHVVFSEIDNLYAYYLFSRKDMLKVWDTYKTHETYEIEEATGKKKCSSKGHCVKANISFIRCKSFEKKYYLKHKHEEEGKRAELIIYDLVQDGLIDKGFIPDKTVYPVSLDDEYNGIDMFVETKQGEYSIQVKLDNGCLKSGKLYLEYYSDNFNHKHN